MMLSRLTTQEKIIIIVLLTVIVWAAGIMLVIKPNIEKNGEMDTKVQTAESQKDQVDQKLNSGPIIKQKVQETKASMNGYLDMFFNATNNYDVDQYLSKHVADSGVKVQIIAVSNPTVTTLDYYEYAPITLTYPLGDYAKAVRSGNPIGTTTTTTDAAATTTTAAATTDTSKDAAATSSDTDTDAAAATPAAPAAPVIKNESCEKTIVTYTVSGTQDQLRSFINEIYKDDKALLVSNIATSGKSGAWAGSVTVEFIAVDKIEE